MTHEGGARGLKDLCETAVARVSEDLPRTHSTPFSNRDTSRLEALPRRVPTPRVGSHPKSEPTDQNFPENFPSRGEFPLREDSCATEIYSRVKAFTHSRWEPPPGKSFP